MNLQCNYKAFGEVIWVITPTTVLKFAMEISLSLTEVFEV